MCRCCQSCVEDLYWDCIEEKFCFDESIANYNPDEDEYYSKKYKNFEVSQNVDNNNLPISVQPLNRNNLRLNTKEHEFEFYREVQTSVPILAPEILSVFANSQIFIDQGKLVRNQTKTYLPGIHGKEKESDQEKLIKKLEDENEIETVLQKKIKFTIASETSPDTSRSISPQKFNAIIEEDNEKGEIILTPQKINESNINYLKVQKIHQPLRSVQSVPYFSFRPASENDIFAISGSMSRISMTPEIPSISYSTLPKNYEDTPAIEKYKETISLYSIQTANKAIASKEDYAMPRYFRMNGLRGKSSDNLYMTKEEIPKRPERNRRLKILRDSLPPLLIHSGRNKSKDDLKRVL